jgi:hypothetical protein
MTFDKWNYGGTTMRQFAGRLLILFVLVVFLLVLTGCQGVFGPQRKVTLWNGKNFAGWKFYVPNETVDVNEIWTVKNGVVCCSGNPNGYMRTKRKYENYRLHLEWRWAGEPANSGVLLHISGPDKLWPRCIESQLQASNAGDLVIIGGTGITVDGQDKQDVEKPYVIIPKKEQSSENPAGQWNTYEIYCERDTIRCFVNGMLQNEGTKATDTCGWIGLQSEGAPIEFRNIYVELLD